jgi:hypothetical protein
MDLSEPDTVFFRACVEHVLSSGEQMPFTDSNMAVLAAMADNKELLPVYSKWFEMYLSVLIGASGRDESDNQNIKVRLAQVLISLRRASTKRG